MKSKKPVRVPNPPDYPKSHLRRRKIWDAAERFGFVGIVENGKRVVYLVSHKFWQNDMLRSEGIVTITSRGKVKGYLINAGVWNLFLSFLRCITPSRRRRLPVIATLIAQRYVEEGKRLEIGAVLDAKTASKLV